ncbi:MAG: hypothetical protein KF819_35970 [Labilithrix sp.]|nr:hypothetical protein [Labilithrix sp.]
MNRRTSLLAKASCAAALVLATTVTPVHAQDAQQQAMGRALFNEGLALFNDGKYDAACPKLEASLKHYPGLGTRGKLAECYEKQGRFASAWLQYREVAQLATRNGDPTREQVASERAKALEPKLSYLTVVVPQGHDASGLVVKRAGKELERAKLGAADPVDPGTIALEIAAPGKKTFTAQITVTQGQSARFEVPLLEPIATAPPVEAPPPPTPPPFTEMPPAQIDPPGWQKPAGIVAMGLGAVGLGVGAAFGLSASSTYDGAFDGGGCERATKTCDVAGQSAVDDARSKATLSTVFFAAGGVLVASGLVLFLTAPSAKPLGLRIVPAGYAGGGGVTLAGSL